MQLNFDAIDALLKAIDKSPSWFLRWLDKAYKKKEKSPCLFWYVPFIIYSRDVMRFYFTKLTVHTNDLLYPFIGKGYSFSYACSSPQHSTLGVQIFSWALYLNRKEKTMKCPRCDEYMEKKGENWICSSCGYSWSEHSLFPLVIVVIAVLVYLAL
jgi:ribosomal protein S27AE